MFARSSNLLFLSPNYKIEPDFPCLADEIAKPRPDINIKVTAFTDYTSVQVSVVALFNLFIGQSGHGQTKPLLVLSRLNSAAQLLLTLFI